MCEAFHTVSIRGILYLGRFVSISSYVSLKPFLPFNFQNYFIEYTFKYRRILQRTQSQMERTRKGEPCETSARKIAFRNLRHRF